MCAASSSLARGQWCRPAMVKPRLFSTTSGGSPLGKDSEDRGTVTLEALHKNLRYLAEGIPDKGKRTEALEQLEKTYSQLVVEEDPAEFQKLLVEAQNHLSFFKMVSRRRILKDESSFGSHAVYRGGKVLNEEDITARSRSTTVPSNQIMDRSQVTSEHRRRHTDLLKRQHFLNR